MSRTVALVFWVSLVLGIAGTAVGYVWFDSGSTDSEVSESETESEASDAGSGELDGEPDEASSLSAEGANEADWIATLKAVPEVIWAACILMLLVSFWCCWHGAALAATGNVAPTSAISGVLSALFLWAAFMACLPVSCWLLERSMPEEWYELGKVSLIAGVVSWQAGFWALYFSGNREQPATA